MWCCNQKVVVRESYLICHVHYHWHLFGCCCYSDWYFGFIINGEYKHRILSNYGCNIFQILFSCKCEVTISMLFFEIICNTSNLYKTVFVCPFPSPVSWHILVEFSATKQICSALNHLSLDNLGDHQLSSMH